MPVLKVVSCGINSYMLKIETSYCIGPIVVKRNHCLLKVSTGVWTASDTMGITFVVQDCSDRESTTASIEVLGSSTELN